MPRSPSISSRSSSKRSRASGRSSFDRTGIVSRRQRGAPLDEFAFDDRLVAQDLVARPRAVHQVDEHARALDVAQKAVAEPGAFVRAFDQAGNVDHDERLFGAEPDDAELRFERRERIVGDLRARRRHGREQGRLAGVREADDAAIGEQLQLEPERAALGRLAALGEARRLARARREVLVAEAAAAALGDAIARAAGR